MIYFLPTIRSNKNGFDALAQLAAESKDLFLDKLEVSFEKCGFFEANQTAPLAAILARVADNLNEVSIVGVPATIETILRKNRFLTFYGAMSLDDINHTALPFQRMRLSDDRLFATYLEEHFKEKGMPQMSAKAAKEMRQSILEIFNNSATHSESDLGIFICGQFYPQKKRLNITITDTGIGIRDKVRKRYKDDRISSIAAIKWAIKEGHTTREGNQPGGMGLKFLMDFVAQNCGKIQIASRMGYYEFSKSRDSFERLSHDLPGTTVNLEVNTNDANSYLLKSEILQNNM